MSQPTTPPTPIASTQPDLADGDSVRVRLLTEAIRGGPTCAAWADAAKLAREISGTDGDDMRAILAARESLELGKPYRTVHAGPGFSRKVMQGIEGDRRRRGPALTTIIALASTVAVLVAVVVILLWVRGGEPRPAPAPAAEAGVTAVASTDFSGPLDARWRRIGAMPVETSAGLTPASDRDDEPRGGGVAGAGTLEPDLAGGVEASVVVRKPNEPMVAQIFVADSAVFYPQRGISTGREIAVVIDRGTARVMLPDGPAASAPRTLTAGRSATVRIVLVGDRAVIDVEGVRMYDGPSGLAVGAPRTVGARFLREGAARKESIVVESLRQLQGARP